MLVDLFIMNCDFDTLCSFALLLIKWPILQLQWHIFFFIYSTAGVTHDRQIYFFIFCCCCHVTMIRCHYRPSSTIWKRITNKKNAWIYLPDRREEKKKTVQLFTFGYDFPRGGLWSSMATAYVPKYRYEPSKLARRKIECFFFFLLLQRHLFVLLFFLSVSWPFAI